MANPVIKGIHHITLCASGAQEDVDFCTQVLGQRLIKQTVLFDGRYAHYHLYYANANAEVGSVLTTFPYKRIPGRPGSARFPPRRTPAERCDQILEGTSRPPQDRTQRDTRALRAILHSVQAPFRLADGGNRRSRRQADRLDNRPDQQRCLARRVSRAGAFRPGSSRAGTVFHRGARVPQDRRRWRVHRFEVETVAPPKPSCSITSPIVRRGAGDSAQEPPITWRSTSALTKRWRNRRISTTSWATPTAPKSRIASTSTRSTCDLRPAS